MMTAAEMKAVDIRTVDRDQLVDIHDVKIDRSLPKEERIRDFVRQIKNPYCFRCGEAVVKMSFADTDVTLEDCMERYLRRDVSLLMNCGKDLSSTMYGMYRTGEDVFIFVTYHKEKSKDSSQRYVDGKPDYADSFEDNMIFRWDSQIGKGIHSTYMQDVTTATRKHLFVKKSDAESNFYYMGLFDIVESKAGKKQDKNGKERDIAKVKVKMRHTVRDDLLRYLQSTIREKEDEQ